MKKINKLIYSIGALVLFSLCISGLMKLVGIDLFLIKTNYILAISVQYILNTALLLAQLFLIIGCFVAYKPKKMFFKLLPFMPLGLLLYILPAQSFAILSILILFVVALCIRPTLGTLIRICINLPIIILIQLFLLWMKLDVFKFEPTFTTATIMLIINIDQFILLALLYFINRKVGEQHAKLDIHREKK